MAKKSKKASVEVIAKQANDELYACRCYNIGGIFEKWILNPKTGTYRGPILVSEAECRACNMSAAKVIGSRG